MRRIGGFEESAFRACPSFRSLLNQINSTITRKEKTSCLPLYLLLQILDLLRILHVPWIRLLHDHRWGIHVFTAKPIRQLRIR